MLVNTNFVEKLHIIFCRAPIRLCCPVEQNNHNSSLISDKNNKKWRKIYNPENCNKNYLFLVHFLGLVAVFFTK